MIKIVKEYPSAEYRPERFPGLMYRPQLDRGKGIQAKCILMFTSGKLVCTGAKSTKKAKEAIHKVIEYVIEKSCGKQLEEPFVKIVNIVASGKFFGSISTSLQKVFCREFR